MKRNYEKPDFKLYIFDEDESIITASDLGSGEVGEVGGDDGGDWDDF